MTTTVSAIIGYGYAVREETGWVENEELKKLLAEKGCELGSHGGEGSHSPYLVVVDTLVEADWEEVTDFDPAALAEMERAHGAKWRQALAEALGAIQEVAGDPPDVDEDGHLDDDYEPKTEEEEDRITLHQIYDALQDEEARWFVVCSLG